MTNPGTTMNGVISDIRVYDQVLSNDQLRHHSQRPPTVTMIDDPYPHLIFNFADMMQWLCDQLPCSQPIAQEIIEATITSLYESMKIDEVGIIHDIPTHQTLGSALIMDFLSDHLLLFFPHESQEQRQQWVRRIYSHMPHYLIHLLLYNYCNGDWLRFRWHRADLYIQVQ